MRNYKHKYHYVYYSYELWGRGYIGARSTNTHPDLDTTYLGSFSDKKFKPSEKIIIQIFSSREEAIDAEINLHNFYQVDINPHFANKRKQTSKKFDYGEKRNPMEGKSHSLETKILISKKMKQKMKEKEHKEKLSKIQQKLVWWNNGLIQTRSQFSPVQNLSEDSYHLLQKIKKERKIICGVNVGN